MNLKFATMKQEISIKLIQSSYARNDAREVLSSILNDKIRFLSRKIFSLQERFGSDTRHQEARLAALKVSRQNLLEVMKELESDDRVIIDCDIHLKIMGRQGPEKDIVHSISTTDAAARDI